MRCKGHLDPVVDIAPLRMMVHLLGQHGHPPHEGPRLREVNEVERFGDGVPITTVVDQLPPVAAVQLEGEEVVQDGGALFGGQRRGRTGG